MAQITSALTIREIEQILYAANPHYEARTWTAAEVECHRDRHRYTGQSYAFTTEIVHLLCCERGRATWEVLIVHERWATGVPETVFRHTKWMRLVAGKSSDLRAWIRRHRHASVASAAGKSIDP